MQQHRVESTHSHLLLTYTTRDIDGVVKWLKQRMTKAIHLGTTHTGPVWCKSKWCSFIFDDDVWMRVMRYIERHNERRGVGSRPYVFLAP